MMYKRQVMKMNSKEKRHQIFLSVLPQRLRSVLLKTPDKILSNAQEIVLRCNRPLCIECADKRFYFTTNNCITDTLFNSDMVVVSQTEVFETFQNICNYSVYSRQNEINNGFITIRGGHRAGICGSAVVENGSIKNIKNITSINIRISREIIGCSDKLSEQVNVKDGVLICGAPCSGKTTLIRDYARRLSFDNKVCVIDERNELSANVGGTFYNDLGMCDVFESYPKNEAIIHSVRNMSPDIIVCDEISTVSDIDALKFSVNSGVAFVATMHADSKQAFLSRMYVKQLLLTQAFSAVVFLDSRHNVGEIKEVVSVTQLLGDIDV